MQPTAGTPSRGIRLKIQQLWPLFALCVLTVSAQGELPRPDKNTPTANSHAEAGVEIYRSRPGTKLHTLGLRDGDQVLSWSRPDSEGPDAEPTPIRGYFHWRTLVIEQGPRGPLQLQLQRGEQRLRFALHLSGGDLRRARPMLPAALESRYTEGQEALRAARAEEAIAIWLGLAEALETAQRQDAGLAHRHMAGSEACRAGLFRRGEDLLQQTIAPDQDPAIAGALWDAIGSCRFYNGELDRAAEAFRKAYDLYLQGDGFPLAAALMDYRLARTLIDRDQLDEAEFHYRRAEAVYRSEGPGSLELSTCLIGIGTLAALRGELDLAWEVYTESLELRQQLNPGDIYIPALIGNLGEISYWRGDLQRAEDAYRRAMTVEQARAPEGEVMAFLLEKMGQLLASRGNVQEAEVYLRRALAIQEQRAPRRLDLTRVLRSLGKLARESEQLEAAQDYLDRALSTAQSASPRSLVLADVLNQLGSLALEKGDAAASRQHLQQAVDLLQEIAPRNPHMVEALAGLAELASREGRGAQARSLLLRAVELRDSLGPGSTASVRLYRALADLEKNENPAQALDYLRRAATALEAQVRSFGGTPDQRAGLRARHASLYRELMDLHLERREPLLAFDTFERSRAQILLQLLAEREVLFRQDLPVELDRARRQWAVRYDRLQQRLRDVEGSHSNPRWDLLQQQLRELLAEREELATRVRQASPRLAELQDPLPLPLEQIQQQLDPGTTVLAYSVGNEDTLLFVVSRGRELRVHRLPVGEEALRNAVSRYRQLVVESATPGSRGQRRKASVNALGSELSNWLLQPAAPSLQASQRLLVVADGPLQLLPWAALPWVSAAGESEATYLVEARPLHFALSTTAFLRLRQHAPTSTAEPRSAPLVAFGVSEGAGVPLPGAGREVRALAQVFPKARTYLESEATEERAKQLRGHLPYLHFATHAALDDNLPLESALLLSPPEQPAPGVDNGRLQVWEIFESLRLDTDLVVLSACETGLGQAIRGEGLIGLTRAFHYAGARSVVASLWAIPDRAAPELMTHFYRHLRSGMHKDEALRQAQIALLHTRNAAEATDDDLSAPYHWAAFQLYGDWRVPAHGEASAEPRRGR